MKLENSWIQYVFLFIHQLGKQDLSRYKTLYDLCTANPLNFGCCLVGWESCCNGDESRGKKNTIEQTQQGYQSMLFHRFPEGVKLYTGLSVRYKSEHDMPWAPCEITQRVNSVLYSC